MPLKAEEVKAEKAGIAGTVGSRGIVHLSVGTPTKEARAARMVRTAERGKAKTELEPWARATEAKPAAKATARRAGAQKASKAIATNAGSLNIVQNGALRLVREAPMGG